MNDRGFDCVARTEKPVLFTFAINISQNCPFDAEKREEPFAIARVNDSQIERNDMMRCNENSGLNEELLHRFGDGLSNEEYERGFRS